MAKKKIIACQIFTDELLAVLPEVYRDTDIIWLDPGLHYNLDKFEKAMKQALKDVGKEGVDTGVLFGKGCHPDVCHMINSQGGTILGVRNCLEAFCHEDIDELQQNRTMVVTPGWVRFFSSMMASAGWDEVDIRQNFGHYDRILLMDTGINPVSDEEILEFFDLIQVPIETQQINLDHFQAKLNEVL